MLQSQTKNHYQPLNSTTSDADSSWAVVDNKIKGAPVAEVTMCITSLRRKDGKDRHEAVFSVLKLFVIFTFLTLKLTYKDLLNSCVMKTG